MNCPQCGRSIPSEAQFCIYCRARVAPQAPEQDVRPATGPTMRLGREAVPPAPQSVPPMPQPMAPTPPMYSPRPPRSGGYGRGRGQRGGWGIWPIGILILIVTGWWWPGILVLLGISSFLDGGWGRRRSGVGALIMFLLLALMFSPHRWGNGMWFVSPFPWGLVFMIPMAIWWFGHR